MKIFTILLLTLFSANIFAQETETPKTDELWLPAIFGDHMVLQQGKDLPVWGKAIPGKEVIVKVGTQTGKAQVGQGGKWMVRLKPLPVNNKPVEMQVSCEGSTKKFTDVLVGDVWLCSGQSNMAMGVGAIKNSKEVIAKANHPELRLFMVLRQVSYDPTDQVKGKWLVCTPKNIMMDGGWKGFSAVAYFFGVDLLKARKIPIGLIGSYVGGTHIQAWSSLESLATFKERDSTCAKRVRAFKKAKTNLAKDQVEYDTVLLPKWKETLAAERQKLKLALAEWKKETKLAKEQNKPAPKRPKMGKLPRHPKNPKGNFSLATVLFNGMVNPLIPYAITGAIWYQGEANCYSGQAENYAKMLPMMITDWRKRWGQGDFPFIFVQLPNLESKKTTWPILRDSQLQSLAVPKTAMAVTIDVGDPRNLHPPIKKPVGNRLALAARGLVYGENIAYSGPIIKTATLQGNKVVLTFDHVGKGLTTAKLGEDFQITEIAEVPANFELAGKDGKFISAQAKIVGDTVLVWHDDIKQAVTVRYAWAPCPVVNLYNKNGLPVSPFKKTIGAK